jgi:hypothetical protein
MSEYETTQEIFDVSQYTPISKSHEEWRFFCPNCEDKRGKPDREGKLYYNIVKHKGWCHKCHTAFYPENVNSSIDYSELEWERVCKTFLGNFPCAKLENLEVPKEVSFRFPELTRELITYLKGRNPFLVSLKDYLAFRGWKGQDTGVVIPFFYRGRICKFQTRFLSRKDPKRGKYYTSEGPKILYSPMHIFNSFRLVRSDEITIAEGVFDAIALAIIGFPNPVALLGDTLTLLQINDLRYLTPMATKAYICLDDYERSLEVAKVVKRSMPGVQKTEIFVKWAPYKDPEEFLTESIKGDTNLKTDCAIRVAEWLKGI